MKTIQFSGRLVESPFGRPTEFFTLSFGWKSSLILGLLSATSVGCGIEDEDLPQQEDAYVEPYREPVYELLGEDDPNQTCCYVQVMRYQRLSQPGGRRACNVDPEAGPSIPCSYPDEWDLKMVDGCPVFVQKPDHRFSCAPDEGD